MTGLPLHPQLVHLPLALAVLMPLIAGGAWFAIARGWFRQRGWSLVVAGQAMLFASGFLAMRSGEADEERVEDVVPHAALESHEEAAEPFVWAGGIVLLLSVAPLVLRNARAARTAALACGAGTLVVLGLAWRAGHSGGELVWRHGAAAAYGAAGDATQPVREKDEDDDR
ncbi:MAG: hypothetical protein HZB39_08870 [Planctomycetes bacterium]|nr:hypothetical protein [Planctomycetota bacterium]